MKSFGASRVPYAVRSLLVGLLVWVALTGALFFYIFQFSLGELALGATLSAALLITLNQLVCTPSFTGNVHFAWLASVCHVPAATGDGIVALLKPGRRFPH